MQEQFTVVEYWSKLLMEVGRSEVDAVLMAEIADRATIEGLETIIRVSNEAPEGLRADTLLMALKILDDRLLVTNKAIEEGKIACSSS
jgi:hypothetical protein